MDRAKVIEMISACIGEIVPRGGIKQDERLKEDLGLDSLSLVSVIVVLEDCFEIVFDDGDLDPANFVTVRNLTDLVMRYV